MITILAPYSIGLDIGANGAWCVLPRGGLPVVTPMPYVGKHLDMSRLLYDLRVLMNHFDPGGAGVPCVAFESLCSFNQGRQSAFNFGGSYHCCWNVARILGAWDVEVRPQDWKRAIIPGLPHNGPEGKKASIAYACRRWPGADFKTKRTLDDNKCEAAMLAEYAMRFGDREHGKHYAQA
jgi:hypothetical protein